MNENVLNKVSSMLSELKSIYAIDSIYFTVGKFLPPEELTLNYFEHCKALRVKRLQVISVTFNGSSYEIYVEDKTDYTNRAFIVPNRYIGQTVFFDEESAEARLESLKSTAPRYSIDDIVSAMNGGITGPLNSFSDYISKHKGDISDGYHTFNELYDHRAALTAALFKTLPSEYVYKSKKHHDGTMYDGMFIACAKLPGVDGWISYHYDIDPWWNVFNIRDVDRALKWDGHTPNDVIERLKAYAKSNL